MQQLYVGRSLYLLGLSAVNKRLTQSETKNKKQKTKKKKKTKQKEKKKRKQKRFTSNRIFSEYGTHTRRIKMKNSGSKGNTLGAETLSFPPSNETSKEVRHARPDDVKRELSYPPPLRASYTNEFPEDTDLVLSRTCPPRLGVAARGDAATKACVTPGARGKASK
jgi:hypothetical protein